MNMFRIRHNITIVWLWALYVALFGVTRLIGGDNPTACWFAGLCAGSFGVMIAKSIFEHMGLK